MSEKKREADLARIRLKLLNETEIERNARLDKKRTYQQTTAVKQARINYNAEQYAKRKEKLAKGELSLRQLNKKKE